MISDEAVEAAAYVIHGRTFDLPMERNAELHFGIDLIRAALHAAAPYIRQLALADAAEWLADEEALNTSGAISGWLRERATAESLNPYRSQA